MANYLTLTQGVRESRIDLVFEPCDPEIYEHGDVVHIEHMPKKEAERMAIGMRIADPASRYDWHYLAGRAVFLKLPSLPARGAG